MKKNNLGKLALMGLSAFFVFGCQAKGDAPTKQEVTEDMNNFMRSLPPELQQKFSQMTDEEKISAIKAARESVKKFYDSLSVEQKQKFDQMTEEQKLQAMQSFVDSMKKYYDSLTPEQKQKFDQMSDEQKLQAVQSVMEKMRAQGGSMQGGSMQNRMPARPPMQ